MAIVNGKQAVIVPAQSVVTVLSESDSINKLIYVLHDGRRVQMFEQDIRERGTPVVNEISLGRAAAG
jgi:mevalonate kinase